MLQRTNGARTIPQIFIGDHYIGGNDKLQDSSSKTAELDKLVDHLNEESLNLKILGVSLVSSLLLPFNSILAATN